MNNRITSLLIAGVLAAPAFAAAPQAEWSLYGTFVTELYTAKTSGATAGAGYDQASRTKFSCATSNLGFKGSMQVASDVKVIWQVESSVGFDGDAPNTWAGRNTALGLTGSWGTVMAGSWDTPYKSIQMPIGHMRASLESDVNIINNAGFNVPGTVTATGAKAGSGSPTAIAASGASFNRRQGNSVQYWSPEVLGLQAKLMYSTNESKSEPTTAPVAVGSQLDNPTLFSGSLTYKNAALGLTVLYGFEQHTDYYGLAGMGLNTGGTHSKDTGHELAVYWIAPTKTRVTAIAEQLKYTTEGIATGNVNEYKRVAWFVSANHPITANHHVWAGFGSADKGDVKIANGAADASAANREYGAKQYQLGYGYAFNKSAEIYAFYGGIKNDKNAQYNLMPQNKVNTGADVRTIGLGMFYKF